MKMLEKPHPSQTSSNSKAVVRLIMFDIYQPFSVPPVFNVKELHSKALARFQQVRNHLWPLQTDPAYLRQVIRIAAESFLMGHPIDEVHKWAVQNIYIDVWSYWSGIVEVIENLRVIETRLRNNIYPGQQLPPKYEEVLQELELVLESQLRNRARPLPVLLA